MKKKVWLLTSCLLLALGCDTNKTGEDHHAGGGSTDCPAVDTASILALCNQQTTAKKKRNAFVPRKNVKYRNLKTGKMVAVTLDTNRGWLVDLATYEPLEYIINVGSNDTIFGPTGEVVNESIKYDVTESTISLDPFKYKIDDEEIKLKFGEDAKIKIEGDETKVEVGDTKTKTKEGRVKTK